MSERGGKKIRKIKWNPLRVQTMFERGGMKMQHSCLPIDKSMFEQIDEMKGMKYSQES